MKFQNLGNSYHVKRISLALLMAPYRPQQLVAALDAGNPRPLQDFPGGVGWLNYQDVVASRLCPGAVQLRRAQTVRGTHEGLPDCRLPGQDPAHP